MLVEKRSVPSDRARSAVDHFMRENAPAYVGNWIERENAKYAAAKQRAADLRLAEAGPPTA